MVDILIFTSWSGILFVLCKGCLFSRTKSKNQKEVDSQVVAFFYNEETYVGRFGDEWSSVVEQTIQS